LPLHGALGITKEVMNVSEFESIFSLQIVILKLSHIKFSSINIIKTFGFSIMQAIIILFLLKSLDSKKL
jgi:hypothetical protein